MKIGHKTMWGQYAVSSDADLAVRTLILLGLIPVPIIER